MPAMTRRTFHAAALAGGALTALAPHARAIGANGRVRLGIVGVGNRGDQLLDAFLPHQDCEFVAISDVYEPYLEPAKQKAGGKAETVKDYRRVLDNKAVDAVVIATPDHWHALQFIDACKAQKDIYCEKPLSLTITEGRRMAEAAKAANRITQVGLHRRSLPHIREAVEKVRGGAIGTVTSAKCFSLRNEAPFGIGSPADCDPPAGLDWDLWLGPAPKVAFNPNRCLYKFRWFWDYSGGQLTNFGTHYLDVIQWALGHDAPRGVFAAGGHLGTKDNRQIPDTMEVVWDYPGTLVTFSQIHCNKAAANKGNWEIEFRGTKGTMYVHDSVGYEIVPELVVTQDIPALSPILRDQNKQAGRTIPADVKAETVKGKNSTAPHARNFLDCVMARKECYCPVETGHRSTSATLLAKVAFQRGRYLAWDGASERVTNDAEANGLMSYEYRKPWKLA